MCKGNQRSPTKRFQLHTSPPHRHLLSVLSSSFLVLPSMFPNEMHALPCANCRYYVLTLSCGGWGCSSLTSLPSPLHLPSLPILSFYDRKNFGQISDQDWRYYYYKKSVNSQKLCNKEIFFLVTFALELIFHVLLTFCVLILFFNDLLYFFYSYPYYFPNGPKTIHKPLIFTGLGLPWWLKW